MIVAAMLLGGFFATSASAQGSNPSPAAAKSNKTILDDCLAKANTDSEKVKCYETYSNSTSKDPSTQGSGGPSDKLQDCKAKNKTGNTGLIGCYKSYVNATQGNAGAKTPGGGSTSTGPPDNTAASGGSSQSTSAASKLQGDPKKMSVVDYVNAAYQYLAVIGGLLAVLMLIYAAYRYMTSYGDPEKISDAKDVVEKTLLGLSLLILAALILNTVNPKTAEDVCKKTGTIDFCKSP